MSKLKNNERWTDRARKNVNDIIENIKNLPFIQGMMNGTLQLESFGKYIGQDIFYCEESSKILLILSERLKNISEEYRETFETFSKNYLGTVNELQKYVKKFNLKEEKEKSAICQKYINFEKENVENNTIEEGIVSLLACYWVYDEIGRYMYVNQIKGENIYKFWMNDYSGEPSKNLAKFLKICNEIEEKNPEIGEIMIKTYRYAVQCEYDFWDDAFKI